jgi:hypothetical protein
MPGWMEKYSRFISRGSQSNKTVAEIINDPSRESLPTMLAVVAQVTLLEGLHAEGWLP